MAKKKKNNDGGKNAPASKKRGEKGKAKTLLNKAKNIAKSSGGSKALETFLGTAMNATTIAAHYAADLKTLKKKYGLR